MSVSWIEGQQAMHEGIRERKAMRDRGQCCTPADGPCPAHEAEAEGRKEARDA